MPKNGSKAEATVPIYCRILPGLNDKLRAAAAKRGISLNQAVVEALTTWVERAKNKA